MTDLLKTVEQRMVQLTPELANAPAHKRKTKAKRSIVAVVLSVIAVALLAGGGWMAWGFAESAREQEQVFSFGLAFALLIPLLPGGIVGAFALIRFDPDAGGVFQQLINITGAAKDKLTGKGA